MSYLRSALYLDFDNVFGGLFKLDPQAAIGFAGDPGSWLHRLSETLPWDAPRRWLILRCYLNPAGSVQLGTDKLPFHRYRERFVRAGFEVIDCPPYTAMKNGADIRIVVDALDILMAEPFCQEFVIASGDSDMTPLLHRLRRADRRTLIIAPPDAAAALTSSADQVLDSHQLLALVQGEPIDLDDDLDAEFTPGHEVWAGHAQEYEAFRSMVATEYDNASEPLNMASLAQRVRGSLLEPITATGWFGFGGFTPAVRSLQLPNLRISQHHMWDEERHEAPDLAVPQVQFVTLPEPVERLNEFMDLPRIPRGCWPAIYEALSGYARSHRFNLTECTAWSRDTLLEQGLRVSRRHIAFVTNGAAYGGCPLHRQPPPTATEIGEAFVKNALSRVPASASPFTEEEISIIRSWLGLPG